MDVLSSISNLDINYYNRLFLSIEFTCSTLLEKKTYANNLHNRQLIIQKFLNKSDNSIHTITDDNFFFGINPSA